MPDTTATAPATPSATSPFTAAPDNPVITEKDDASIIVDAIPADPVAGDAGANNVAEPSDRATGTPNSTGVIERSPRVDAASVAV